MHIVINKIYDGAGLGLTIVKMLAEMYNVSLWVKSKLGYGFIFLKLPID